MKADELQDFDDGLRAGFDHRMWTAPQRGDGTGPQVTTLASPWHMRHCATCGHTFRRDDRVVVEPAADGAPPRVRHLDPTLGCTTPAMAEQEEAELVAFSTGVLETWPVSGTVSLSRTNDEPHLLAPPAGSFPRQTCLVCAHTFRPMETVIVCPCSSPKRLCRRAVHRDPVLGMVCWEAWRPGSVIKVCPVTLTRLS